MSRYGLISEGLEEEARLYLTVNIHELLLRINIEPLKGG